MNHSTLRPTPARTFTWVPLLGGLVVIALGLSADCHGQLARQSSEESLRAAEQVAMAEHLIRPGESPQPVLDRAVPGDRVVLLPGLHQHGLGQHRAMLYVEKSIEIELREGAILKLADHVCQPEKTGEITTDQDAGKKLDDLEIGGEFDLSQQAQAGPELYDATIYTIRIDHAGADGEPDTFAWGDGQLFETPQTRVPITGDWQELSHGVKMRFKNRAGHSVGSLWFVSYDGPAAYGIRIGHGRQADVIENVRITGRGTIDLNATHNAQPSGLVKDINACVLIHGRVRGVLVEGITMTDTMRSVMCFGEHTGAFLPGGKVGPGESFDAEDITIQRTRTINPKGAAYLLGHPSFRGQLRRVKCNFNYMETGSTAIEPNFNLDGYEVIGNVIKSAGQAIHCWRRSRNGIVADNLRIDDPTGKPVVKVNAPRGWENPDPPVQRNNRNHLSDPLPAAPAADRTSSPNIPPHPTEQAVEQAHAELWKRFVDEHNLILDYVGLKGEIVRPTPEDCREMKPNALSWGVPNEDGPMFNGLYLDGACNRWKLTQQDEDRAKARRLIDGLLKVASIGKTPGFIARGLATDGKTTYPMGSNDQTTPWLVGIWRYVKDGVAKEEERGPLIAKFIEQVTILDQNGWRMPTDGPPSKYRGDFTKPTWEAAPRLLFVMKAMHHFTGEAKWQQRYLDAANEKVGKGERPRLEICRTGMVFDPGQGPRHSWTGSEGVICLRALWEMETDPARQEAYAQGLRRSAELAAQSLPLIEKFDVNGTEVFNIDWRVMNEAWSPQLSEKDAVAVANAGLRVQHRVSPRMRIEKDYLREPCFAAWVVTLCPDREFVEQHRAAIERVITHYRFDRVYLSQFFPVESAWYRLRQIGRLPKP